MRSTFLWRFEELENSLLKWQVYNFVDISVLCCLMLSILSAAYFRMKGHVEKRMMWWKTQGIILTLLPTKAA